MNPVHTFPVYFPKINLILSSYLCLGLLSGLFPSGFPTEILYTPPISPMYATCPAHLILSEMITLIIFAEAYKLWSSFLGSILQPPNTFCLLGPNILLSTLFSNNFNYVLPLVTANNFRYGFVYFNLSVFKEERGRKETMNKHSQNLFSSSFLS